MLLLPERAVANSGKSGSETSVILDRLMRGYHCASIFGAMEVPRKGLEALNCITVID
jgi:hypothetical protein